MVVIRLIVILLECIRPVLKLIKTSVYISPVIWKNLVSNILVKIELDPYLDLLGFSLQLKMLKCVKLFPV